MAHAFIWQRILLLACFLPPLYTILQWGGVTATSRYFLHIQISLVFALTLTTWCIQSKLRFSEKTSARQWIVFIGGLFLLCAALSFTKSQALLTGIHDLLLFTDTMLLFISSSWLLRYQVVSRDFKILWLLFGTLISLYLLLSTLFLGDLYNWLPQRPLLNPNHVAGLVELLIFLPLAEWLLAENKRRLINRSILTLFLLLLISLLLTLSRGGLLAFLITIPLLLLIMLRDSRLVVKRATLLFLGTLAVSATIMLIVANLVPTKSSTVSLQYRKDLAVTAARVSLDYPLLGAGPGSFQHSYLMYTQNDTTHYQAIYAHNDYLQVLAEEGFVGLVLVLLLIYFLLASLRRADANRNSIYYGAVGGIVCLLIHSLFDFNLRIPCNLLLFTLLAAVLTSQPSANGKAQNTSYKRLQLKKALVAVVVLLFLLPSCYTVWLAWRKAQGGPKNGTELSWFEVLTPQTTIRAARELRKEQQLGTALKYAAMGYFTHQNAATAVELGHVMEALQRKDRAEYYLKQALQHDRNNAAMKEVLARFYLREDRLEEAIQLLQAILLRNPERLPVLLGVIQSYTTDPVVIAPLVPSDLANQRLWIEFLRKNKYLEFALKASQKASQRFPHCDSGFKTTSIELMIQLNHNKRATEALRQFQQDCPKNLVGYYLSLAAIKIQTGSEEEALQHYLKVLWLDDRNRSAIDAVQRLLQRQPALLPTWHLRLQELRKNKPMSELLETQLVLTQQALGRWRDALRGAKQLVIDNPDNSYFRKLLASLYEKGKMYSQAIEAYKEALRLTPRDSSIHIALAEIYLQLEMRDQAIKVLSKASKIAPESRAIHRLMLRAQGEEDIP